MNTNDLIQIVILLCLLLLSGFFSSAETAMTTVSKIRIKSLADSGNRQAATMLKITEHSDRMLSAILIGNNIVNIAASSLATTLSLRLFGSSAVAVATGLMTLLVLVFGEITPKTLATVHAERLSLAYSGVIWGLMQLMRPLIFLVNLLSSGLLRLFHIDKNAREEAITAQELRTMVEVSHEEGAIQAEEHRMLSNVFDFRDALAKDVMVPRADMVCVRCSDDYQTVYRIFRREKYTRLPVCESDRDDIVGILNIKDFMFVRNQKQFHPSDVMYQPFFTYENKKTSELMTQMQKGSISLAIVLDEYGEVSGMVTMEDLLEELVGEIRDEYDKDEEKLIQPVGNGEYLIEGAVRIDDLNEALGLHLSSEDYDSVGGYIIEQLDHLPSVGETVTTPEGDRLRVEKRIRNRIKRVRLIPKSAEL